MFHADQRSSSFRGGTLELDAWLALDHLDQQWPKQFHAAPGQPQKNLLTITGGHAHEQPIVLSVEFDLDLVELHASGEIPVMFVPCQRPCDMFAHEG